MEDLRSQQNSSAPNEIISSLHHEIEKATKEVMDTFKKSAQEVRVTIESEFAQRPWTFIASLVGTGVVIGFIFGKTQRHS